MKEYPDKKFFPAIYSWHSRNTRQNRRKERNECGGNKRNSNKNRTWPEQLVRLLSKATSNLLVRFFPPLKEFHDSRHRDRDKDEKLTQIERWGKTQGASR